MTLHLVKLCVGVSAIEELQVWIDYRQGERKRLGQPPESIHTTRMIPKRVAELLDGGSLYWVIKGQIAARERLLDLRPVVGADGIGRTDLVLSGDVVPVHPRPCRPFQGWRYLAAKDAPADLGKSSGAIHSWGSSSRMCCAPRETLP